MFKKEVKIVRAEDCATVEKMCHSILRQIHTSHPILKIAFFSLPADNEEFLLNNQVLRNCVKAFFPTDTPVISYIAQQPYATSLSAEVTTLTESDITIKRKGQYILLEKDDAKELITEGIIPQCNTLSTFRQSANIFSTIEQILEENNFIPSDIYRQWNYIEGITFESLGSQNYQEFNDARSAFYNRADWSQGYPAATGIGMSRGGVMIELYATKGKSLLNRPIDNPMQISAHSYSQNVLAGNENNKTTPKFERARIVGNTIYISGTAAIHGEKSIGSNNTLMQAAATMEIMDYLISPVNIPIACKSTEYDLLRVYVKHAEDVEGVKNFMDTHYPVPQKQYLVSDICRPELLIEIEGIAHIA